MSNTMTVQRLAQIVAAYGADPQRWPETERDAATALVASDISAQRMLREARTLDQWLDHSDVPAFAGLETRLLKPKALRARKRSTVERLTTWLLPSPDHLVRDLWRPATLACIPLAMGLFIGSQFGLTTEVYASAPLEEELYLISLSDYAEIL